MYLLTNFQVQLPFDVIFYVLSLACFVIYMTV